MRVVVYAIQCNEWQLNLGKQNKLCVLQPRQGTAALTQREVDFSQLQALAAANKRTQFLTHIRRG
jgi:hypothetical protein